MEIKNAVTILTRNGTAYAKKTVDPESIRYDAATNSLFWVSEIDQDGEAMLRQMSLKGHDLRAFQLPEILRSTEDGIGHVKSASLESLAISPDGKTLYTVTKNALKQDGPRASATTVSPVRILQIDKETGTIEAEYLYITDPVGHVSMDAERPWSDNGITELLDRVTY